MDSRVRMLGRRFWSSEDGASLVFVTITLPALIGFALLAVDASRVYNLHYDLQKGADAFALAAAAELDRTGDACERADRAIDNLLANQHSLSDLGIHTLTPTDLTVHYLSALPDDDDTAIDYDAEEIVDCPAGTPAEQRQARFVEVIVNPTQITSIFPARFVGAATNTLQPSASAVAGYGSNVCKFTPMYICNPYEGADISLEEAVLNRAERRKLIELRPSGGSSDFSGSFGYLCPATGSCGANELRDRIARVNPETCFAQDDGVSLQHGAVIGPVREAINVRFDLYRGFFNGKSNDPNYRPARNVRKGYKKTSPPPGCNNTNPEPDTIANGFLGLPRDDCFAAHTCGRDYTSPPTFIGDGDWDLTTYWEINHRGTPFPAGLGWADTAESRPTRYEVYRAEISDPALNTETSKRPVSPFGPGGETGLPICYSGGAGTLNDSPDRRLIYAAILNCQEILDDDLPLNEPLPVEAFGSFFLIEPVTGSGASDPNIYIELVDINSTHGGGTLNNVARDDVQLYR